VQDVTNPVSFRSFYCMQDIPFLLDCLQHFFSLLLKHQISELSRYNTINKVNSCKVGNQDSIASTDKTFSVFCDFLPYLILIQHRNRGYRELYLEV
jgi:hypothetical protein